MLKKEPSLAPHTRGLLHAQLVLGKLQLENALAHFPPKNNDSNLVALLNDYNNVLNAVCTC